MAKGLLIATVILLATIMLLEVCGRFVIPKEYINGIGDPDHRMKPFSEKDINEDGIRFRGDSKTVAGKQNIIFLGDSFTYGYRLSYKDTIPQQFERTHNLKNADAITAINFGWISSSPYLSNRLLGDIGKKYHPQTVFLLLDMTDIWDDNLYSQLLSGSMTVFFGKYLPISTILVYQTINHIPPLYEKVYGQPINRFFHSAQPLAETEYLFARTTQTINEIAAYSRNTLHANFVLVVLPRNYQYSDREAPQAPDRYDNNFRYQDRGPYVEEPFRYFAQMQETADYPVILLLDDFKHSGIFPTTFDNDSHYNAQGARFAANAIYNHCQKISCLGIRPISQ